MNTKPGELTSALLDGELDPAAQERVISATLEAGEAETGRFARYRLIGDVMRGESSVLAMSVAEGVQAALRQEPAMLAPMRRRRPKWLRPVAGLAVAASVAGLAVALAPPLLTSPGPTADPPRVVADLSRAPVKPGPVQQVAVATAPAAPRLVPATPERRWQAVNKQLEERLNRLVIEHHEFGGRTGIHGPVPHIGLASYGER